VFDFIWFTNLKYSKIKFS